MEGTDGIDRLGRALLARLAEDPDNLECARQFDSLFYEIVWRYLRLNHSALGARVARYLGVGGSVAPTVLEEEVDEVAHDATATALRRVRHNAGGFDPRRGTPTQWVIGSATYAYVEVATEIVNARRSDALRFVDPAELIDAEDPGQTTEEHVLRQLDDADALADAASHLSEREFAALRLRVTACYSRAEAAEAIFGDPEMKKQVDGLVERASRKLAEAWTERKSSRRVAGGIKFPTELTTKEGTDE
jgi:DNA-directed RNA polymerase specialized sigma24 family protein